MAVSYDKQKRDEAAKSGRILGTVSVAGLTFQGTVTPTEQGELIGLYQKINARATAEAAEAAKATGSPSTAAAAS